MTKPLSEMIAWLEKKIERDTEWMRFIEGLNVDGESFSPTYDETKNGVEICQAILSALAGPRVTEVPWERLDDLADTLMDADDETPIVSVLEDFMAEIGVRVILGRVPDEILKKARE